MSSTPSTNRSAASTTPSTTPSTPPSTAPSTRASSTKASTAGTTIAGSTAGTAATSTGKTIGTAPSGNPPSISATGGASDTNDIRSWFEGRKSVLSGYLDKVKHRQPAAASTSNANASLMDQIGQVLTNLGDGVTKFGNALVYHFDCTQKSHGTTVLEANGTKATIRWGPSPDGQNHFNINTGANQTTNATANGITSVQTTVPPDLSAYVSTKEKVKRPPIPSSLKSFFETPFDQRETAPFVPLEMFDQSWKTIGAWGKKPRLDRDTIERIELNSTSILGALAELKQSEATSATFQSHFPTFEMYDRACRMEKVPDTPIDKAKYAAACLWNQRGVPLSVDDQKTLEKTLYKYFKKHHDHPPTLQTTHAGLDPYNASMTMMTDDGVPTQVTDTGTQTGRYLTLRNNEKTLREQSIFMDTPLTNQKIFEAASKITDWAHQYSRYGKPEGEGVEEEDVREYVLDLLRSGKEIPRKLPQSIIDDAKARRQFRADDKSFDNCRGPEISVVTSENGPAVANRDLPSNHWSLYPKGTNAESEGMKMLKKVEGRLSQAAKDFINSFPSRV